MNGEDIANLLVRKLLDMGFIVHRYNSYSTSSIYLKLDYGVCNGIRIADHKGKKKYCYRFNVMKDYRGDKVIIKDGLICRFYDFNDIEHLLEDISKEKETKISRYGLQNYQKYIEKEKLTNELFKRFKQVGG